MQLTPVLVKEMGTDSMYVSLSWPRPDTGWKNGVAPFGNNGDARSLKPRTPRIFALHEPAIERRAAVAEAPVVGQMEQFAVCSHPELVNYGVFILFLEAPPKTASAPSSVPRVDPYKLCKPHRGGQVLALRRIFVHSQKGQGPPQHVVVVHILCRHRAITSGRCFQSGQYVLALRAHIAAVTTPPIHVIGGGLQRIGRVPISPIPILRALTPKKVVQIIDVIAGCVKPAV